MKRIKFISIVVCLLGMLFVVNSAHATLELLGQGTFTSGPYTKGPYNLIYDTDLDVTWYDYSYINSWWGATLWADDLRVTFGSATIINWRLPSCLDEYGNILSVSTTCTNDEMRSPSTPFQNLQSAEYWLGTSKWPAGGASQTAYTSYSRHDSKSANEYYAIAMMDGRAGAVAPEPISSTLFLIGGATLGFRRFRKKFKK